MTIVLLETDIKLQFPNGKLYNERLIQDFTKFRFHWIGKNYTFIGAKPKPYTQVIPNLYSSYKRKQCNVHRISNFVNLQINFPLHSLPNKLKVGAQD